MADRVNDKPVALVTGGSRGIGLGIAQALGRDGFDIAFNGRRDASEVVESLQAIEATGANAHYLQGDIGSSEARQALLEQLDNRLGRLDVLVNNAGVSPTERKDLLEATEESFDRLMDINLKGPHFLTQAVANWMIDQQNGLDPYHPRIINIGSISATVVSTNRGEYCVSKAGMAMLTQLWAVRLAECGIDVFEVRPGIIETDMTAPVKEKYDKLLKEGDLTVEKRWGQPEDIARATAVLARGEVTYAPGQVIHVDGGITTVRL
jgi:NAD(P)-dependent dehydrogenase (short-subunit alcohol dehydrogenase family)